MKNGRAEIGEIVWISYSHPIFYKEEGVVVGVSDKDEYIFIVHSPSIYESITVNPSLEEFYIKDLKIDRALHNEMKYLIHTAWVEPTNEFSSIQIGVEDRLPTEWLRRGQIKNPYPR